MHKNGIISRCRVFAQNNRDQLIQKETVVIRLRKLGSIITHKHTASSVLALEFASPTCTLPLLLFQSCLAALRVCRAAKEFIIVSAPTHASAVNISEDRIENLIEDQI